MNPATRRSGGSRGASVAWVAGAALLLAGCLIIPVDYYATGARHNITPDTQSRLRIGETTREEVLLTLGEPDFVSDDGTRVGYAWTKVKALVVVASYGGGGGFEVTRSYVLELTFDTESRVTGIRLLKNWGDAVPAAQELAPAP